MAQAKRQCEILAQAKTIQERAKDVLKDVYHRVQKPSLFAGGVRRFEKIDDETPDRPIETQRVQVKSLDAIEAIKEAMVCQIDAACTREEGNTVCRGTLVVGGEVLAKDIPVGALLFLERELTDLRTVISKWPTLDPGHSWKWDGDAGVWRTEAQRTASTSKVHQPIVKYDATPEHPAQTELITVDKTVGYWATEFMSGGLSEKERKNLLARVETLLREVKAARERANTTEVTEVEIGETLLNYVFSGQTEA